MIAAVQKLAGENEWIAVRQGRREIEISLRAETDAVRDVVEIAGTVLLPVLVRDKAGKTMVEHIDVEKLNVHLQALGLALGTGADIVLAPDQRQHTVRALRARIDQLGLNWDIATVGGYVIYAHGLGSIGNETPSWQGELGVRRPVGQVFMRYESYRMRESVGPGNTFVVGVGVNL